METEQTISQIVAEVAAALKDAATEYGPQAADLALLAYRVDAIKSLLLVPVAAASIYAIWRAGRWIWSASDTWGEDDPYHDDTPKTMARAASFVFGGGLSVALLVEATVRIIDLPLWLAAFGQPELLIATRALQAAGLM